MGTRNSSSFVQIFLPSRTAAAYELLFSGCAGTGHPEGISVGKTLANKEEFLWRAEGEGPGGEETLLCCRD